MKKIILPLLLLSVILAGCGNKNWLTQDELFQKKQECNSYYNSIINDWNGDINELSLKEIFYSPVKNTCMYIFQNDYSYYIYDILNQKEVFNIQSPFTTCWWVNAVFSEEYDKCEKPITNKFNQKIKELKWE